MLARKGVREGAQSGREEGVESDSSPAFSVLFSTVSGTVQSVYFEQSNPPDHYRAFQVATPVQFHRTTEINRSLKIWEVLSVAKEIGEAGICREEY